MLIKPIRSILIILIVSACATGPFYGSIRVGLLSLNRPLSLTVSISEGEYRMFLNGKDIPVSGNDNILVGLAGDKILVTVSNNTILADSLVLSTERNNSSFLIRNNLEIDISRSYYGDLVIKADIQSLLAINIIDIERYLAGVVQAEAGYKGNIEYFKTQSLLARTYLYMHLDRHTQDGYNLCDKTHCQAYHGISSVERIREAINLTQGKVLVNADSLLVFTPFHSNCGGQTESSENVWLTKIPHLASVTDPYCTYSPNAKWLVEIPVNEWINHLESHGYRHKNNDDLAFNQLSRKRYYTAGTFSYPLVNLRDELKLKSAFFSVSMVNDNIVLNGRGYGHGVGLCQEGARVMAKRGFKMREIINFYFRDLLIIDIKDVKPAVEINSAF